MLLLCNRMQGTEISWAQQTQAKQSAVVSSIPVSPLESLINFKMDHVISAVAGEVVSRFVSFVANRYGSSRACSDSEEKQLADRLQQLLLRARTVVEEADARFITNSGMLAQLKVVGHAMYRGYWVLDTFEHRSAAEPEEVISGGGGGDSSLSPPPPKRCRAVVGVVSARRKKNRARWWHLLQLQGAVESLENAADNMAELVLLLGGCERLLRRPYDAYLYNDTVMFGRHAEKQELLNFMLRRGRSCSGGGGRPAILPIIGAPSIGKRTLVAHVCRDERVTSHFSSILHLNEDSFLRISDHDSLLSGKKTLLVVEFVSDVNEKDWDKFYSYVASSSMDKETKVIIISRNKNSEKLGTVKPIFLECLPYEEFSYLFKTLVFASANPVAEEHHPRLARIADEFARELQSEWSLVAANLLADVMRRNLNADFWLCVLGRVRRVAARNLAVFGEHPKRLVQRRHQIDVTDFVLDPASAGSRLRTAPCCVSVSSRAGEAPLRRELPKVTLGDLVADASVRPRGEFNMLIWESRLPPYTSYLHFVNPSCAPAPEDMPEEEEEEEEDTALPAGRKRRWLRF